MIKWRHNEENFRWEFGSYDIDRDKFTVLGAIDGDLIAEVITDAARSEEMALLIQDLFGSLPPPLENRAKGD